jgi:hypothetical protein
MQWDSFAVVVKQVVPRNYDRSAMHQNKKKRTNLVYVVVNRHAMARIQLDFLC